MTLKQFISLCLLWFLIGTLFGGILFGNWWYYKGQKETYKKLYDDLNYQASYQGEFERSA